MKLDELRTYLERRSPYLAAALALAVAALLPVLLGGSLYALDVAKLALIYSMFVLSWDVFCGMTGETSFGHTFFIGTAGFAAALGQVRIGLPPASAVVFGTLIGALGGLLIGLLTLRHTGAVFAMVTMAMQLTFHRTLFIRSDIFGGEEGVLIPRGLFTDARAEYAWIAVLAVGMLLLAIILRTRRFGRQLRVSGGDTRVGLASGVPVRRTRLIGFTGSGLLAGLGGSMLAMHNMLANHEMAGDALAGLIFLLATAGGAGTLLGPWVASIIYVAIVREALMFLGEAESMVVFGLLVVVIWIAPEGLGVALRRQSRRILGWCLRIKAHSALREEASR